MQRDLVVRAQAGDHDAFTALVASSINRLYAAARLILRRDDLAEDAVQEALVKSWTGIGGLRDPDRFDAWLRRLLIHASYRVAKRERIRQIVEVPSILLDQPVIQDRQATFALRDQLDRGFRRMPPDQRAVLVVHYYLDLPDADAADALGIPVGTLKSRLNRAKSALKAALEANDRQTAFAEGPTR